MKKITYFEVIVVGGGHAGVEAAAASSRMGAKTALITHKKNKIGENTLNTTLYFPDTFWIFLYMAVGRL